MSGPLTGLKVIEIAGLGPGPFCGMMLADLGADVTRIERLNGAMTVPMDLLNRGRKNLAVNLKSAAGVTLVKKLVEDADVFIEGFRPGVIERLGLGPDVCHEINPALVYGRITGWGQTGPVAERAGHDINYIALAGALEPIGPAAGPPSVPLNFVADFGGGGMLLAVGILAAIVHARATGEGQVIDAAMTDGTALLTTMFHGLSASGMWQDKRESNLLDGGAPFYRCYETSDGKYMSVGAIEPKFYLQLLDGLGLTHETLPSQYDQTRWPDLQARFEDCFKQKTSAEWRAIFEHRDACVYPVLSLTEAPHHPHNRARGTFVEVDGVVQPAPAPRFSKTPVTLKSSASQTTESTTATLKSLGISDDEIEQLRAQGAIR
ncbi:MAG: CaiB/BaiF CoA transferase family protein [Bradymonadia bacterium]